MIDCFLFLPSIKNIGKIKSLGLKLFSSIRSGGVISDTENGAKSTLAAILGRMATYTGKKLTFDQVMKSKQKLVPENMNWDSTPPTLPDSNGYYEIPTPGKTKFI